MVQRIGGLDPLKYLGVKAPNPPNVIIRNRAPTTADFRYDLGTIWIRETTSQSWMLVNVTANIATWGLSSPGASDVDTLTGDSGGAISPAAGNITLAGGTNITSAGSGSTITFDLDSAIVLATSVSTPLLTSAAGLIITAAAGNDIHINAPAGQDIIMKMGDAAGANKVSFTDSADVEVASIDSDGTFSFGATTFTGLLTAEASATIETAGTALNLGSDNSGDDVNLGVGTVARAINIGTSAAAHVVSIGNAAAGAISLDTAAGVSIDAAAASNFTVSGAGIDLTLASGSGRVVINGEEAADNAITLLSAAGGIDADAALQINIASSEAAADAIRISASNAAGGIDVDDGGGGMAFDSLGAISLDAAAASNFSVSGAGIDLTLASSGGRVILNGEEAAANALTLLSAAGGIDADAALQINIASSQAAADAIRIDASNAAGGIDIDDGGGGMTFDSLAGISIDAAAASNFTVTGAGQDLTLASSLGSVLVSSTEDAALAIRLHANGGTSETIQLHSDQGTGVGSVNLLSDAGGITLTATGLASDDAINLEAVAGGIDLDASMQINIASSEAASDAIVISASNAAGGITIDAGTAGVNVTGADLNVANGNLALQGAASQISIDGGAATDFIGTATLVNGQVTINNTNIAATDQVYLTRTAVNASTALGQLLVTINAGTSFTIISRQAASPGSDQTGDLSSVSYVIFRMT